MAKEILTLENGIKYAVLLCTLSGFYYKQLSDIRELGTEKKYEIEHLQYQITELKDCCNNKHSNDKLAYRHESEAILPSSIEIKE